MNARRFTLGIGLLLLLLLPLLWVGTPPVRGVAASPEGEVTSAAAVAEAAIELLERVLDRIVAEAEEGEFDEALVLLDRFEALLAAVRDFLVEAAGEIAQEELAEIEQFIERLEDALEAEDAAEAKRIIALIRHELEEIREALEGRAGVEVEIGSAEVASGEQVTVLLEVERLEKPLGAYNFTMRFDPTVVQAREVTVRYGTALPAPLIDNEQGTIRIQGIEPAAPQTGDLVIAELTFEAVGAPGTETELQITVEELADPDGEPIEVGTVENGRIAVK